MKSPYTPGQAWILAASSPSCPICKADAGAGISPGFHCTMFGNWSMKTSSMFFDGPLRSLHLGLKNIRLLLSLLTILTLTACGAKDSAQQIPEDFNGNRRFEECFGSSAENNGLCFEFSLDILNSDDNQQLLYSIDGPQTLRRLVCDIEKRDGEYKGLFNSYHEEDIHYSVDYEKGNAVFTIIKKNNDYYIKNFQSPYDQTLIKREYILTPSNDS